MMLASALVALIFSLVQQGSPVRIPAILDSTHNQRTVGGGYGNALTNASRLELETRVRALNDAKPAVTVLDFLDDVDRINVTFVVERQGGFDQARAALSDLFSSLLLQPHCDGPSPSVFWAEGAPVSIEALVFYRNGRIGHLQANESHLFVEDHNGVGWWYRWYPAFPRQHR